MTWDIVQYPRLFVIERRIAMNISVKQKGGFVGDTIPLGSLDTEQLNEATAQRLEGMLKSLDFFNLPADIPSTDVMADALDYEITVQVGKRVHTVTFRDDKSPQSTSLLQVVKMVSGS